MERCYGGSTGPSKASKASGGISDLGASHSLDGRGEMKGFSLHNGRENPWKNIGRGMLKGARFNISLHGAL